MRALSLGPRLLLFSEVSINKTMIMTIHLHGQGFQESKASTFEIPSNSFNATLPQLVSYRDATFTFTDIILAALPTLKLFKLKTDSVSMPLPIYDVYLQQV